MFVPREDIMTAIKRQFALSESHNRVALVGLGGVGYGSIMPQKTAYLIFLPGNRRSPLNIHTGFGISLHRLGSSGFTQAAGSVLNKPIER